MRNERAFTLLELVVVLTIMALVMGMVGIAIYASLRSTEVDSAASDIVTLLRHARDVALYQKKTVHVVFEEQSGRCYLADYDSLKDTETPFTDSSEGPIAFQLPQGMRFAAVDIPADTSAMARGNAPKNYVARKYVRFTRFGTASPATITLKPDTGREILIVGDTTTGYFSVPKVEDKK